MNKKIAFIIPTLRDGGAERVLSNMSINLDDDIDQRILVWDADGIDYPYKGELVDLNLPYSKNLFIKLNNVIKRVFVLKKYKRENKIGTSISHLEGPNIANILSKGDDKVVVCVHNFQSRERQGIKGYMYKILMKKLYNKADLIVCVSQNIKHDLINNFKLDEDKIQVIYNPFDISKIEHMMNEELEEEYKSIFEKPVVISVGRLTNQKAQWNLIRSFVNVRKSIPNCNLVILGQGELEKELKDLVKEMDIEDNVFFLGFQNNPFKFISRADVFALTSLYEGFPMCLAEAMACKTAVISVDCKSGPREMLAPGTDILEECNNIEFCEYGVLSPEFNVSLNEMHNKDLGEVEKMFSDALIKLLQDKELRSKYEQLGKSRVNNFDVSKILSEWLEVFN